MSRSSVREFISEIRYRPDDVLVIGLRAEHAPLLGHFDSRDVDLNDFLKKDAFEFRNLHLGVTYLLLDRARRKIISYITLSMGSLKIPDQKEFVLHGRKLADYPKDFPMQFPALLIGRVATTQDEEGRGGAHFLVEFAVSMALELRERLGCGFLLAHAISDARVVDWYKQIGFKTFVDDIAGRETVPMYLEME